MARIRRVLIANRGEIAVRVLRTLRELDIASIAVYSEPDRAALHVLLADEAYPIGPGPAAESYLNQTKILEVAREARADAIHPGYGFFAENAGFARACAEAGIVFIGPRPETIATLGDKLAAREVARAAGVPLVPGTPGPVASLDLARDAAKALGYPLMLKAAAGGGGKGLRIVRDDAELQTAWSLTRGEARSAFGDDQVYLERAIERPRHVEAQILADASGRVAFLGERECSVQRRHQKLLEETPSPGFTPDQRGASRTPRAASPPTSATSTPEPSSSSSTRTAAFYFLEVNTRLQVEHPVTEMVTRLDLVAEQIRIAEGDSLSFDAPPTPNGWSMEARVIAEDPLSGFIPSTGRIERLRLPSGPGVRNDAGIYRGYEIPVYYDSLLSKLVVWAPDRERARRRLARALDEFVLEGVHNNLAFHRWLVTHPEFAAGHLSTKFLDDHFKPTSLAPSADALDVAVVAAALHAREERSRVTLPVPPNGRAERSAWRWADRRRAGGGARR